jgi:hypothetical protein
LTAEPATTCTIWSIPHILNANLEATHPVIRQRGHSPLYSLGGMDIHCQNQQKSQNDESEKGSPSNSLCFLSRVVSGAHQILRDAKPTSVQYQLLCGQSSSSSWSRFTNCTRRWRIAIVLRNSSKIEEETKQYEMINECQMHSK